MPHRTPLERAIVAATELKTAQANLRDAVSALPSLKRNRDAIQVGAVIMSSLTGTVGEITRVDTYVRFGETYVSSFEVKWDNGRTTIRRFRQVESLVLLKPASSTTAEKTS